jgi:hypothetical protein
MRSKARRTKENTLPAFFSTPFEKDFIVILDLEKIDAKSRFSVVFPTPPLYQFGSFRSNKNKLGVPLD